MQFHIPQNMSPYKQRVSPIHYENLTALSINFHKNQFAIIWLQSTSFIFVCVPDVFGLGAIRPVFRDLPYWATQYASEVSTAFEILYINL